MLGMTVCIINTIIQQISAGMEGNAKKTNSMVQWRENCGCFYDFVHQNFLDWPVTSVQWGPLLHQTPQYSIQRLYFSCKTDGVYSQTQSSWTNTPNYLIFATLQIPTQSHYFINDLKGLFNCDTAKKHPNLKIKQVVSHPGQITVVRTSPMNRKLLASKSQTNMVYLWTNDKYKLNLGLGNNTPNTPDVTLMTSKSDKHNYALRFCPSLPRLISASGDKLQLFDIDAPPSKRQLGSVLSSSILKPLITLTGHDGVEDIAFKNNQICVSGGMDKEIGVWDLRIGCMVKKVSNIHQSDINCVGSKDGYILSGGEDGRVNVIDDRTYNVVEQFQIGSPIHSLQFNPLSSHFALGSHNLSIFSLSSVLANHELNPLFTHLGTRGNINELDWNTESPMTIATTYQEVEDVGGAGQGGIVHVFRPLDFWWKDRSEMISELKEGWGRMTKQEQTKLAKSTE